MTAILMKGKPVADVYRASMETKISEAKSKGIEVIIAIVIVGDDPASHVYKGRLVKLIESLGGSAKEIILPGDTKQEDVIACIKELNADKSITGILPMMPMPKHINDDEIGASLAADKDVDCLNVSNAGEVFLGRSRYAACTPRSCMAILKYYGIELSGKHAVVIGRSNVVGKPVSMLLLQKNCTVTICHSHTRNLSSIVQQADIVVAAVGRAGFVTPDMIKDGAVIVDVGINMVDGKLCGDVDPACEEKASAFTPVPGGVGVVSNMMVMDALTRNI